MKVSSVEKAFFMGVGFHYLATHRGGFLRALNRAAKEYHKAKQRENARIVDPHNRTVEI